MFLRYPAASKVSAKQISLYVADLAPWPATAVSRAIAAVRADTKRNPVFPPSCDEIAAKLRSIGLTKAEQRELCQLRGLPLPIEHKPEPEATETEMTEQERSNMQERIQRHMRELGCREGATC